MFISKPSSKIIYYKALVLPLLVAFSANIEDFKENLSVMIGTYFELTSFEFICFEFICFESC